MVTTSKQHDRIPELKPGYVLACALILGLVLGFNAPSDPATDDTDGAQVQSFLYADEDVL